MITFPNAKINIGLQVTERRPDGYHNLDTIFYPIPLHDALEVIEAKGAAYDCRLHLSGVDIAGSLDSNLVVRAYRLLSADHHLPSVDIYLHKHIPTGAGLGGGSADAAAVLVGLNALFGCPLDVQELCALGERVGADVPFCLHTGTYLAEGIGEILTKLPDMPKCHIVVCKPRASVSSKNAYGVYDTYINKQNYDHKLMLAALEAGDIYKVANAMGNSFEAPIGAENPEILQIKQRMLDMKALNAAMTGSGSVVFGIFDVIEQAHACKAVLRQLKYRTYCVKPVN